MFQLRQDQLDAYVHAVYEVQHAAHWIEATAFVVEHGAFPATLISAWNPWSQPLAQTENDRRHIELQRQIEASGCRWWPARGRAVDGSWVEPGFLVLAHQALVDTWARVWQQHAVWVLSELSLTPVLRLYSPFAGADPPRQLANLRLEWVGCDPPASP